MYTIFEVGYLLCSVALLTTALFHLLQILFGIKSGFPNSLIFLGLCGLLHAAYHGAGTAACLSSGLIVAGVAIHDLNRQIA